MNNTPRALPRARTDRWYRMAVDADRNAQVYLYDVIDSWGGVTARDFVREWEALDADHIDLYVNSPGGDVYEAIAIRGVIERASARVVAHVDGLAASAASFIVIAADKVVMGKHAEMMVHDAWGYAYGNAEDMARVAADLNRVSDNIASMYAAKGGGDAAAWRDIMRAETWYSAEEAVTAGLADRVDADRDKSDAKASLDLSVFAHAGRAAAPAPRYPVAHHRLAAPRVEVHKLAAAPAVGAAQSPAEPVASTHTQQEGPDIMPDIKKGLVDRLGITDVDATEETILAALDEALAERAEPAQEFTAPEGTTLIEASALAELQAQARQGAEAREQQIAERRTGIVDSAIRDGKIPPARREHWLAQLAADEEGTSQVLASLAAGTIPLAPAGFTGGVVESSDEDTRIFARAWGDDSQKEA